MSRASGVDPTATDRQQVRARRARLALIVAAVALQVVLLGTYYYPQPKGLVGDEVNYLDASIALQSGEGFNEPLRAPLYPYFLAALGATPEERLPTQIVQIVLLLAAALLFGATSRELFMSPRAAYLTTGALLLYPTLAAFAQFFWPEVLHLALWGGAFYILASQRRSPGWLLAAGLLLSLAALTRHLLLPFLPVVLVALALERTAGRWRRLAWLTAPIIVLVGTALWIDWRDDGRLRSASNAEFNLWVGLNDSARRDLEKPIVYDEYVAYLASADTPKERDHRLRRRTRQLIADQGVLATLGRQFGKQYFRLLDHGSFFTEQLPGGRAHGGRRGYGQQSAGLGLFFRAFNAALYGLILFAAVWGVASARIRSSRWLQVALAFIAYNLVLFLALHVKSRYRLQLLPFLVLFGAPAAECWWRRLRGAAKTSELGRWQIAAAIAATIVVALLAFGGSLVG